MATDATADLHATRESAMRVAQALLSRGQKSDAIEILTAWASAANDQEGHKLLAEALRHGPDNPLAKAAFARMEGLKGDAGPLDAARRKWSFDALTKLEQDSKKPAGGWQAEVGYNNNVKYRGQVFHIQTEDSGTRRPHIITHLFADGGRILKSYKRSYSELIGREDLVTQVRLWMKNQHKEMYIALREGRFDGVIDGKEAGGMEVLEGAPNPEIHKKDEGGAEAPTAKAPAAKVEAPAAKVEAPAAKVEAPVVKPEVKPATPAAVPATGAPRPGVPAGRAPSVAGGPPRPGVRPTSVSTPEMPALSASTSAVRARLHVIRAFGDGPMVHEVRDQEVTIGRAGTVVVQGDRFVAPQHVRLSVQGDQLRLEALGDHAVFVRIKQPTEIELGDVFVAGDQVLRIEANPPPNDAPDRHPTYFYSSPKWTSTFRVVQIWEGGVPGLCVVARTNAVQIGRAHSDLCFPNDFWLSDAHCLVEDQGGGARDANFLMLSDLGSRGGTFVQVKSSTPLTTGDEILVGRTRLRVELPSKP